MLSLVSELPLFTKLLPKERKVLCYVYADQAYMIEEARNSLWVPKGHSSRLWAEASRLKTSSPHQSRVPFSFLHDIILSGQHQQVTQAPVSSSLWVLSVLSVLLFPILKKSFSSKSSYNVYSFLDCPGNWMKQTDSMIRAHSPRKTQIAGWEGRLSPL